MTQQSLFEVDLASPCPRCGNPDVTSMEELEKLVTTAAFDFAPDIAQWVLPPKSPDRPKPKKRRVAARNSIAFGIALTIALSVSIFALTGTTPGWTLWVIIIASALSVSTRTWRSESKGAEDEEAMLLETHGELYRAYLHRRKVWSRLRYCCKCAVVTDPITLQTRSLFDIHELANRRTSGASLQ